MSHLPKTIVHRQCRECGEYNITDFRYYYCSPECKKGNERKREEARKAQVYLRRKEREEEKARRALMENFNPEQGLLFAGVYDESDERSQLMWVFEGDPKRNRMPALTNNAETLREAQNRLIHGVDDGTMCPCCGRFAKVYRRSINKNMANGLMWMVREFEGRGTRSPGHWIDMPSTAPKWMLRSNQFATLRWWQLIERRPNEQEGPDGKEKINDNLKHLGMWRPTERGIMFAHGELTVPKSVMTLFGEPIGYSEDHCLISDCLDKKFDIKEAMESADTQAITEEARA